MNQVIQTVRTFQTSDGPGIEARVSDPNLGDVTLIVTGRAGEIVQAQLVARDRVAADALTQAASRIYATSDALAGVSVTVRSESGGGSTTGGRAGGNPFGAAGWSSTGGQGNGPSGRGDQGQGVGGQTLGGTGTGPGSGAGSGAGFGMGSGEPSRSPSHPQPVLRPEPARTNRPMPPAPPRGGRSLDIRA